MRVAAVKVIDADIDHAPTRIFTAEEFAQIQRAQRFVDSVAFWRTLDRLAHPEAETRFHATLLLRELAELAYVDCGGCAFSPHQAECFEYCGLVPKCVRPAGSLGRIDTP
jgi:hypothetical protein